MAGADGVSDAGWLASLGRRHGTSLSPRLLLCACRCRGRRRPRAGARATCPTSPVVTQDGKVLNFYDDLIKDKIFVISFLFTSCRTSAHRDRAAGAAAGQARRPHGQDIFFYSISIDPETDTPDQLKQYAETFRRRARLAVPDRHAGGHQRDPPPARRTQPLSGRTSQRPAARQRRDRRVAERFRAGRPRSACIMVLDGMDPTWRQRAGDPTRTTTKLEAIELAARPPGEALYLKAVRGLPHGRAEATAWARIWPASPSAGTARLADRFHRQPGEDAGAQGPDRAGAHGQVPNRAHARHRRLEDRGGRSVAYIEGPSATAPSGHAAWSPCSRSPRRTASSCRREDIKGRPLAVAFGFTHCPDVCPTTLLDWSNALADLGPDGDRLKVLFVSVDSERDTPEALKAYMASFDPRITALTGSPARSPRRPPPSMPTTRRCRAPDGSFTFDHTVKTYMLDGKRRLAGSLDIQSEASARRKLLAPLLAQ